MTTVVEQFPPWLRDLNRFFGTEGPTSSFVPPADVLVTEDGVTVYMDVPGLSADKLDIELENDVLSVRGERPYPYTDGDGSRGGRRIERGFGRFERSLRVPPGLDPNAIEASLADGVLTLKLPKPESQKPRRIDIRPGTGQTQDVEGSAR
jgi:HSP20 family protein